MKIVYYQGERGCFSELAAQKYFNEKIEGQGYSYFEDVFKAVKDKKGTFGVLPIENSTIGSIYKNYDLLLKHKLWIVGEVSLKISYNLLANKDTSMKTIEEVWSHPAALDQCEKFIKTHSELDALSVYDTAGAAKIIKEEKRKNIAAIAHPRVAKLYGLKVLKKKIEDNHKNFTRFLVLSSDKKIKPNENVKSSLVFGVKDVSGILFKCLSVFALRNINLTKIESRPNINTKKPWKYYFYIDFQGSLDEKKCSNAIESLSEVVNYIRFLGSYEVKM